MFSYSSVTTINRLQYICSRQHSPFLSGSDIINTDGVFLPRGAPGEKHGGSEEEHDEKQVDTQKMSTSWHLSIVQAAVRSST